MKELEWCRKKKYSVMIEVGCYKITDDMPLVDGFYEEEVEVDGVKEKYAVKKGTNILEQNSWTTSPQRPYVVTGTVNERWAIKEANLKAYDVDNVTLGVNPTVVYTKDPSDQPFLLACNIPEGETYKVYPSWAFRSDGTIDETQAMIANSKDSILSHDGGDYLVFKHIDGMEEYIALPQEVRNTKSCSKLYDPRIINANVMSRTYDHARTQEEILNRYKELTLKL